MNAALRLRANRGLRQKSGAAARKRMCCQQRSANALGTRFSRSSARAAGTASRVICFCLSRVPERYKGSTGTLPCQTFNYVWIIISMVSISNSCEFQPLNHNQNIDGVPSTVASALSGAGTVDSALKVFSSRALKRASALQRHYGIIAEGRIAL